MIVNEFVFKKAVTVTKNSHPKNAIDALRQAAFRRVDLVMMSDSNGLSGGSGFDSGFQYAMSQNFSMYATGIVSANQGGFGIGYKYGRLGAGLGATTGAPAIQENNWKTATGAANTYAYIESGGLNPYAGGIDVNGDCPIGVNNRLIAHFVYGEWSAGGGTFQPSVKAINSPSFYKTPIINTNGVDGRIVDYQLEIPAANRPDGFQAKWYDDYLIGGVPQSQNLTGGKFIGYYSRIENPELKKGFSVTPLYSQAGHTMFDFAYYLRDSTLEQLGNFFNEIRKLHLSVNQKPHVVIYTNTAVNDRGVNASVSRPTIGPRAFTSGSGSAIYLDNYEYIVKRIQDVWAFKGWDLTELFFLLIPSHVTEFPESQQLVDYRNFSKLWATRANIQVIDASLYTTYQEMIDGKYYDGTGNVGSIHLSEKGYNNVALDWIEKDL